MVTWDPFHSWANFKWRFSTGKRPDPNHLRLHPGMMSPSIPAPLNLSSSKQQPASTFCFGAGGCTIGVVAQEDRPGEFFLPNIVGHWANVIHRLSAETTQARELQFDRWVCAEKNGSFFGKRETHKVVWNSKKDIYFFFECKFTETIILCVCISIFGVVVYAMRLMCLRNPSIRNYNVVYFTYMTCVNYLIVFHV